MLIKTTIRIINKSKHELPKYATSGAAGFDIRANLDKDIILKPGEWKLIPTGLYIELPKGTVAYVMPRSGLALKHGITVLNAPGVIDEDYRGEVQAMLINMKEPIYHSSDDGSIISENGNTDNDFIIKDGERIAQIVISEYKKFDFEEATELSNTNRGDGGFGSTGTK